MDIDMPSTKRMRTTEALDPTLPAFDSSPSSDEDFPVSNYLRRQKRKQVRSNDEVSSQIQTSRRKLLTQLKFQQAKEGSVKDIDSEDMDADHEDNKAESRHSRKRKKAQPGNEVRSQIQRSRKSLLTQQSAQIPASQGRHCQRGQRPRGNGC